MSEKEVDPDTILEELIPSKMQENEEKFVPFTFEKAGKEDASPTKVEELIPSKMQEEEEGPSVSPVVAHEEQEVSLTRLDNIICLDTEHSPRDETPAPRVDMAEEEEASPMEPENAAPMKTDQYSRQANPTSHVAMAEDEEILPMMAEESFSKQMESADLPDPKKEETQLSAKAVEEKIPEPKASPSLVGDEELLPTEAKEELVTDEEDQEEIFPLEVLTGVSWPLESLPAAKASQPPHLRKTTQPTRPEEAAQDPRPQKVARGPRFQRAVHPSRPQKNVQKFRFHEMKAADDVDHDSCVYII
jgi:hypothetical protein